MGVIFRKLGLSFSDVTLPAVSPTSRMGDRCEKTTWVHLAFLTTFCSHSCSCLLACRSYTFTLPSSVMAAKTVEL